MIPILTRYRAFASMRFREPLQESLLVFVTILASKVALAVMLTVWRAAYDGRASVAGMTLDQTLTYLFAQSVFGGFMMPSVQLAHDLWSGRASVRYLRPVPLFGQYIAEAFGRLGFGLVAGVPGVLLVAWLLHAPWRPSGSVALFAVSLALSMALGLAVEMITGAGIVWFEHNAWAADWLRSIVLGALSGAWLPLAFLPFGVGRAVSWLPFASMVSTPLRIYIGEAGPSLLLPQVAWTLVCWPFAAWLWRRARQRVVLYGG